MAILISRSHVARLLDELCVDLGFCLPPDDRQRLMDAQPSSVDDFSEAVFVAEGLDSRVHPVLRKQVRGMVAKAFSGYGRP